MQGQTALHTAAGWGCPGSVSLLLQYGADPQALFQVCTVFFNTEACMYLCLFTDAGAKLSRHVYYSLVMSALYMLHTVHIQPNYSLLQPLCFSH